MIGLITGLTGSITSFSSWMLSSFFDFANLRHFSRSGFESFLAGILDLVIVMIASFASFYYGKYLVKQFNPSSTTTTRFEIIFVQQLRRCEWIGTGLGLTLWILMAFLSAYVYPEPVWLAAVFGPLGTWTRFGLAQLNQRISSFPIGTFIANMLGVTLLALMTVSSFSVTGTPCLFVLAVSNGYCGCLSTVSTFIIELDALPASNRWRYALATILSGLLIVFAIAGSYVWSKSLSVSNTSCS